MSFYHIGDTVQIAIQSPDGGIMPHKSKIIGMADKYFVLKSGYVVPESSLSLVKRGDSKRLHTQNAQQTKSEVDTETIK